MVKFLRFLLGLLHFVKQHFSFRSLLKEGRFLLQNLSSDQGNQDVLHKVGQLLPANLEPAYFCIGTVETSNKWKFISSKLPGFTSEGVELKLEDVQLMVRQRSSSCAQQRPQAQSSMANGSGSNSNSSSSSSSNNYSSETSSDAQAIWLQRLRRVPSYIKRIEFRRLHICYEDQNDCVTQQQQQQQCRHRSSRRALLAGLAFKRLVLNGEQMTVNLDDLQMHLSPPIGRLASQEELKTAMSDIFSEKNARFHPVLLPLSFELKVSLFDVETSRPRAELRMAMNQCCVKMTKSQYDLMTQQVDRLNRIFHKDSGGGPAFRSSVPETDKTAAAAAAAKRPSAAAFDAKIHFDLARVGFALCNEREQIFGLQLDTISLDLWRTDRKYSLKAKLNAISATGTAGGSKQQQLLMTQCCSGEAPAFAIIDRPSGKPCCVKLGTCRITHCCDTAASLSKFFHIDDPTGAAAAAAAREPEEDEELLATLRFLTRGHAGRPILTFCGRLEALSFALPVPAPAAASPCSAMVAELTGAELDWLELGASSSSSSDSLIWSNLGRLGLKPSTAPAVAHRLRWRCRLLTTTGTGAGSAVEAELATAQLACELALNAAMDMPRITLVMKTDGKKVQVKLCPASLVTVASTLRWSWPSLSELLGLPAQIPRSLPELLARAAPQRLESPLQWQAYLIVDELSVSMVTSNDESAAAEQQPALTAQLNRLRLNAVKQPSWLEFRLLLDLLLLQDGQLCLLSSQLDALEGTDDGESHVAKLKRVHFPIPNEPTEFLSILVALSPERLSAKGGLHATGVRLHSGSLARCLHLAEDICRRVSSLPVPPSRREQQPQPHHKQQPQRRLELELQLTDAKVAVVSQQQATPAAAATSIYDSRDKPLCTCRLSQLRLFTSGDVRERLLELSCTGLEVEAARSLHEGRWLLLADDPEDVVAKVTLRSCVSESAGNSSSLSIDCRLCKMQVVLLPQLLRELQEFGASIQTPLVAIQRRFDWQAGAVLQSAEKELRQAGGLTARAELMAPRLILPIDSAAAATASATASAAVGRAVCVDLGRLELDSCADGGGGDFAEFLRNRPTLRDLATSAAAPASADRLRLRLSGLSVTVARMLSGPRPGSLYPEMVMTSSSLPSPDESHRLVSGGGGATATAEAAAPPPEIIAEVARRRCRVDEDQEVDVDVDEKPWLAVAMETAVEIAVGLDSVKLRPWEKPGRCAAANEQSNSSCCLRLGAGSCLLLWASACGNGSSSSSHDASQQPRRRLGLDLADASVSVSNGDKGNNLMAETRLLASSCIRLRQQQQPLAEFQLESDAISLCVPADSLRTAVAIGNVWRPLLNAGGSKAAPGNDDTPFVGSSASVPPARYSLRAKKLSAALLGDAPSAGGGGGGGASALDCQAADLSVELEWPSVCRVAVSGLTAAYGSEPLLSLDPQQQQQQPLDEDAPEPEAPAALSASIAAQICSDSVVNNDELRQQQQILKLSLNCPRHRLGVAISTKTAAELASLVSELASAAATTLTTSPENVASSPAPHHHHRRLLLLQAELCSVGVLLRSAAKSRSSDVAHLSIEPVGPVWLKSAAAHDDSPFGRRLGRRRRRQLSGGMAAAVERLHRRWQLAGGSCPRSAAELTDDNTGLTVRFNDDATTAPQQRLLHLMTRPKCRQLERLALPGLRLQFDQQLGRIRLQLGRLQLDQPAACNRRAPAEGLLVPLSLRARPGADVAAEGRLVGGEIELMLPTTPREGGGGDGNGNVGGIDGSGEAALVLPELTLSLGRLELAYDAHFFARLAAALTPPPPAEDEPPVRGLRVERLHLRRSLRLAASHLPLAVVRRLKATVPAGSVVGLAWTGNEAAYDWAKREICRLLRSRPVVAVSLPLSCLLAPCLASKQQPPQPAPMPAWAAQRPTDDADACDGNAGASSPTQQQQQEQELLDRIGRCSADEVALAVSGYRRQPPTLPLLLLTTRRLLELADPPGERPPTRQLRLDRPGLTAVAAPDLASFRLVLCGGGDSAAAAAAGAAGDEEELAAFSADAEFTRKLLDIVLPEGDTAL